MERCKHCHEVIPKHRSTHHCSVTGTTYDRESESGDFLLSMAIGAATNNALLGGLLGGDMTGGIIGDVLNGGSLFD